MKRLFSLLMATCMMFTLFACGSSQKAFDASKAAYDQISIAYGITEQIGSDIYEVWRMAIYDDEDVMDDGAEFLAKELNLSEEEIIDGVAYTMASICDDDWNTLSDVEKDRYRDYADYIFYSFEDDLFSFCVLVVSNAYIVNGEFDLAEAALEEAKVQMKQLSEKYSDYEHYPNLKGYYTTTRSFFDFYNDPEGSFEQLKTTINDYRNEARDYINDLDYIFEE